MTPPYPAANTVDLVDPGGVHRPARGDAVVTAATSSAATARATRPSRAARRLARHRPRPADRRHGPVGLGQVDAHAHPRRAGHAHRGPVTVAGQEITGMDDDQLTRLRRDHIGFIFQFFNLLPMLTAAENIALPLKLAGGAPDPEWLAELIGTVGLGDRLGHRPSELSGGQQQRVAVARALVSRPSVMFADEPTGNLDSTTSGEILGLLRDSVDTLGQTTVMVTHDAHAAAIADRVLFLADGDIVRDLGRSSAHEILATLEQVSGR